MRFKVPQAWEETRDSTLLDLVVSMGGHKFRFSHSATCLLKRTIVTEPDPNDVFDSCSVHATYGELPEPPSVGEVDSLMIMSCHEQHIWRSTS